MGTPQFAVPTLRLLCGSGQAPVAVFTQPDRPSGRGRRIAGPPVKELAQTLSIPVFQPLSLKGDEAIRVLSSLSPDLLVVVAYGLLLPRPILDIPSLGAVNLHPSLLPRYRGAAPVNWAVIHGEAETGVTTMLLNERMDAGDIIMQERTAIGDDETAGELEQRLALQGAELVLKTVAAMESGGFMTNKQDETLSSRAPKLQPSQGEIDWSKPAEQVRNLIRGLTPRPGAFTHHNGLRIEIIRSMVATAPVTQNDGALHGQIVETVKNGGPVVLTGGGLLQLLTVKPQGKRSMAGAEFLRGYRVQRGDRFR
jgi:methionyl-tRNA formyltransferase